MDRPFPRRTFWHDSIILRTDSPADTRSPLSDPDSYSLREDGEIESSVQSATGLVGPFSAWLEDELESLEERFRAYWTRQSLIVVLIAVCEP